MNFWLECKFLVSFFWGYVVYFFVFSWYLGKKGDGNNIFIF